MLRTKQFYKSMKKQYITYLWVLSFRKNIPYLKGVWNFQEEELFCRVCNIFCLKHNHYRCMCMLACHTGTDLFLWNSVEVLLLTSVLAGLFLPQAKFLVQPTNCALLPLLDPAKFFSCYPWKPNWKKLKLSWLDYSIRKRNERKSTWRRFELTCQRGWVCDPEEERQRCGVKLGNTLCLEDRRSLNNLRKIRTTWREGYWKNVI